MYFGCPHWICDAWFYTNSCELVDLLFSEHNTREQPNIKWLVFSSTGSVLHIPCLTSVVFVSSRKSQYSLNISHHSLFIFYFVFIRENGCWPILSVKDLVNKIGSDGWALCIFRACLFQDQSSDWVAGLNQWKVYFSRI